LSQLKCWLIVFAWSGCMRNSKAAKVPQDE
jgi:hypothetical protein